MHRTTDEREVFNGSLFLITEIAIVFLGIWIASVVEFVRLAHG